jgi:hypothetical protein
MDKEREDSVGVCCVKSKNVPQEKQKIWEQTLDARQANA